MESMLLGPLPSRNLSPSRALFETDDTVLDEEFNLNKTEELDNDNDDAGESTANFTSLLLIILLLLDLMFLRTESFF